MKLGIVVPNFCGGVRGAEVPRPKSLRSFAVQCEKLGFHGLWVIDHLLVGWPIYSTNWLDPLITLAYLASETTSIALGTSILVLPMRSPMVVAKEFATLDVLSNGRPIFGAGVGWWDKEFEATDIPKSERGKRLTEEIQLIKKVWTEENASFKGSYYSINNVNLEPKPLQKPHPPIWMAGGSATGKASEIYKVRVDAVLKRVARFADGWIARAYTNSENMKRDWDVLGSFLNQYGRSPSEMTFAHLTWMCTTDGKSEDSIRDTFAKCLSSSFENAKKEAVIGSKTDIVRKFEELAGIGVQYVIVWPASEDYDLLNFLAKDIMPSFGG